MSRSAAKREMLSHAGNAPSSRAETTGVGQETRPTRAFRPDINALRAIAVTIVVLFHFGIPPVSGGFIGVDVFFVISGFLMSRIIEGGLERGRFTVLGFYVARVRRIVPALMGLVLVTVPLGLVLVDPITMAVAGKNTVMALLFVSNIQFAFQDGYFAPASDTNWLLHTWTLSVEWQFYLLYPLVLLLASRVHAVWSRRLVMAVIACAVLFGATIVVCGLSERMLQFGFFVLPTRAWELLAGGCVAFAPALRLGRRQGLAVQLAGLAAIAASALTLTPLSPWPSPLTALPVLGTAAVLLARRDDTPGLGSAPVQALGTWSYSLYLWHWPVLVALHYAFGPLTPLLIVAGLLATLVVSVLSYELVEIRLRDAIFAPSIDRRSLRLIGGGALWVLTVAICLVAWRTEGLERFRIRAFDPPAREALLGYKAATRDWVGYAPCGSSGKRFMVGRQCHLGDPSRTDVIVFGDSHVEEMLARYAEPGALPANVGVTFLWWDGCPPIPDVNRKLPGRDCIAFTRAAFDHIARQPAPRVVLSAFWTGYFGFANGAVEHGSVCLRLADGSCPLPAARDAFDAMVRASFLGLGDQIAALRRLGKTVAVVGVDLSVADEAAALLYQQTFFARRPVLWPPLTRAAYSADNAVVIDGVRAAADRGGATLVDPLASLCDPAGPCALYQDGRFVLRDGNHVRASVIRTDQYRFLDRAVLGEPPP